MKYICSDCKKEVTVIYSDPATKRKNMCEKCIYA